MTKMILDGQQVIAGTVDGTKVGSNSLVFVT
jgi:hypothetical protein